MPFKSLLQACDKHATSCLIQVNFRLYCNLYFKFCLKFSSVCNNEQTEQRLRLEITFADSKIKYLKDQLAELNCDWTLYKMKSNNKQKINELNGGSKATSFSSTSSTSQNSSSTFSNSPSSSVYESSISKQSSSNDSPYFKVPPNYRHLNPLPEITITSSNESKKIGSEFIPGYSNLHSMSPSSSSSASIVISPPQPRRQSKQFVNPVKEKSDLNRSFLEENQNKSADIMIYLNRKETTNNMDLSLGFKNFIAIHYQEEPANYSEQLRQFNYFREVFKIFKIIWFDLVR